MKNKLSRIGLTILVLTILVMGYGGLCQKKSKDDDTSSGGSGQTTPTPPTQATLPIPADGAIDVIITTQLSWASVVSATSYDVYFGVTTTGWSLILNTINTTYNPGTLLYNTTYYWRIDSENSDGITMGNIWSFQTLPMAWAQVAAGNSHSLALKTNGTIWAWGLNDKGQLGLGDTITRTTPARIGTNTDWAEIKTSYSHNIVRKNNRTLWGWGYNLYGQLGLNDTNNRSAPVQIGTDSDWNILACGKNYTISQKTNKTIWAWGDNTYGQLGDGTTNVSYAPKQIGTDSDWITIATGWAHTIGLKTTGILWSWGYNNSGQLGLSDTMLRTTPTQIEGYSDWSMISCGGSHTLGIKTDLTLWTWGGGFFGQLGRGVGDSSTIPLKMRSDSDWIAVSGGNVHNLALKTNNTLWSWGYNMDGQLGLGYTCVDKGSQCQVNNNSDWVLISAGYTHSLALKSDGTLWVWGLNDKGQLGLGDTIEKNMPHLLGGPSTPSLLIATVISSSRIDLSWNDNSYNEDGFQIESFNSADGGNYSLLATVGQNVTLFSDTRPFSPSICYHYRVRAFNGFGNGNYSNEVYTFISGNWLLVTAGGYHTIGLKTMGTLWTWGQNNYGQLGDGTTNDRFTPMQINTNSDWLTISAGEYHNLGLKSTGTIWSWGGNWEGHLGLGDHGSGTMRTTPTQIGNDTDWSTVICGCGHSIAQKTNRTLWAWGNNPFGQLGDGTLDSRYTPRQIGTDSDWFNIAGGEDHTIGLKTAGTLWAWGRNDYGPLGLGDGYIDRNTPTQVGIDSDWTEITAGDDYTLALKTTGTLWGWGHNWAGQVGDGTENDRYTPRQIGTDSDWIATTAGCGSSFGLKTIGTLWAWGYNGYGQLGDGTTNDRITPRQIGTDSYWFNIAVGEKHTIGFKTMGTLWTWGGNDYGQLGLGNTIRRNTPTLLGE